MNVCVLSYFLFFNVFCNISAASIALSFPDTTLSPLNIFSIFFTFVFNSFAYNVDAVDGAFTL
jgi:hypothetical protein